jgi:uncharacterized RDD family membrane protein YckC
MAETTSNTQIRSPAGAGSEPSQPSGSTIPPAGSDRSAAVSDLALGGLLIAIEALDEWVDRNVPNRAQALEEISKGHDVLLPQSEWRAAHGRREPNRTQLVAVGAAASATGTAVRATRLVLRAGGLAVDAARWPLDHVFLLSPVRHGIDRIADVGSQQVERWAKVGMSVDAGSRAVAEVSLARAAQDSVGLMTVEPHVQVLIQEIIAAQGTSMTKEIVKEIREHSVSLDMRVDKIWANLRGRPAPELATPDFSVPIPDKKPDVEAMAGRPYLGGAYAGFVSRVLAFSIDIFALILALVVGWVFVKGIVSIFSLDRVLQGLLGAAGYSTLRVAGSGALATVIACVYWVFGWIFVEGSIGKLVMGLRVVGPGGARVGFWRSLRRLIGYFISACTLGLGFVWLIINNRRHDWADKLAGTSVVYAWHARPDETFLVAAPPAETP